MARIAFIGLGNMGRPMSANLVRAGHRVSGHDVVESNLVHAADRGVLSAGSAFQAAQDADFVFTMLPTGREVLDVLLEGDRLVERVGNGTVVIDASTTDLETTDRIHAAAAERGIALIDAPVSGGIVAAEAGELTFMAGGDPAAVDRAEPLFSAMGKKLVRAGGPRAGQAVKVCNNLLLGITMIGACEAVALGEAVGVDHQVLFDVMSTSSGSCWSITANCPIPGMVDSAPSSNRYEAGFMARLMLKDLGLARDAAAQAGAATPLGGQARDLYERFCAEHDGGLDFSAIIQMLRAMRQG